MKAPVYYVDEGGLRTYFSSLTMLSRVNQLLVAERDGAVAEALVKKNFHTVLKRQLEMVTEGLVEFEFKPLSEATPAMQAVAAQLDQEINDIREERGG